MKKTPGQIALKAYPPLLTACFNLVQAAGAEHFALFGGAIRDADYAARHNQPRAVKDYDLRIWLPPSDYDRNLGTLLGAIARLSKTEIVPTPSAGTGRIRYCLNHAGAELDISIRPIPEAFAKKLPPPEAVAIDRAADSDVGICSVAIDPLRRAWATPEYEQDQDNLTLTVYPNLDPERLKAYTARMQTKFPHHTVIPAHRATGETWQP